MSIDYPLSTVYHTAVLLLFYLLLPYFPKKLATIVYHEFPGKKRTAFAVLLLFF